MQARLTGTFSRFFQHFIFFTVNQAPPLFYQRNEFLPERKAALEAWAQHVLAAAERRAAPDNVVKLARAG